MNKLCLGTVQLGMHYGINNAIGRQPKKEESFEILDIAFKSGIKYIDTAAAYGCAEKILGEYGLHKRKDISVISKLPPNIFKNNKSENSIKLIENEIKKTLCNLNLSYMDGYLLHTPEYFYNKDIMLGMVEMKKRGFVKNIGVSIYDENHAIDVVKSGICDYIQIPYSIFDQRLDKTDFFTIAENNNVKVFARSSFLQGLILMDESVIPKELSVVLEYLKIFDVIIEKYNFNRLEAALLFSYTNDKIDKIVFGVETKEQLMEDVEISSMANNFCYCREELKKAFSEIPKNIIIPSLWRLN